jgi:mannonate dehydratase
MLTPKNLCFARQCGATHIVAHLVDYLGERLPGQSQAGWGVSGDKPLWTLEELLALRRSVEAEGLTLHALENFDPAHWYDVLLDGPKRDEQIAGLKTMVQRVGEAGISVIGYNFSIAGVWGWTQGPYARGGALSVGFDDSVPHTPIPNGQVWNMTYDPDAPSGTVGEVSTEQLWDRLERFLHELLPVAEAAGVRLALHPDDPPMPTLRGTARLVYQPQLYQRVLDLYPSRANALELCLGSLQEMQPEAVFGGDLHRVVDHYAAQDAIGYVHFRNVRGRVPNYFEVFVDEGDVDMLGVLQVLDERGFDGVLIPDHTPQLECGAPWHAGMAFALGYMRAGLQALGRSRT